MQEGCISLMQMAKTSAALAVLAEQRIPVFVLLADPTYGGVTASFATLGDVLLAEPDAMIGFAGRSIVESTIKQKLPDSFQRADFLLEHGMIDLIVPRGELRAGSLVVRLQPRFPRAGNERLPCRPSTLTSGQLRRNATCGTSCSWRVTLIAQIRWNTSPIFSGFQRLSGDRLFGEDASCRRRPSPARAICNAWSSALRGRNIKENVERNFGMPHPKAIARRCD